MIVGIYHPQSPLTLGVLYRKTINFRLIYLNIFGNCLQSLQEQRRLLCRILIIGMREFTLNFEDLRRRSKPDSLDESSQNSYQFSLLHFAALRWPGYPSISQLRTSRPASMRRCRWQSYLSLSKGSHPASDCLTRFCITAAVLWITF
jgi:hypothetical protein